MNGGYILSQRMEYLKFLDGGYAVHRDEEEAVPQCIRRAPWRCVAAFGLARSYARSHFFIINGGLHAIHVFEKYLAPKAPLLIANQFSGKRLRQRHVREHSRR